MRESLENILKNVITFRIGKEDNLEYSLIKRDYDILREILEELNLNMKNINPNFNYFSNADYPIFYINIKNNRIITLRILNYSLRRLPKRICELKELECLNLNNNSLEELPESFGELRELKYLYLSHNKLRELPESFGELKKLECLCLSHNNLRWLPESFGELKSLKWLFLEYNQLRGLPKSLCKLKLEDLKIFDNELTYLPDSIKENNLICNSITHPSCFAFNRYQSAFYYFKRKKRTKKLINVFNKFMKLQGNNEELKRELKEMLKDEEIDKNKRIEIQYLLMKFNKINEVIINTIVNDEVNDGFNIVL